MPLCYKTGKPCWWHFSEIDDNVDHGVYRCSFQEDDNNNQDNKNGNNERNDINDKYANMVVDNNMHENNFVDHVMKK